MRYAWVVAVVGAGCRDDAPVSGLSAGEGQWDGDTGAPLATGGPTTGSWDPHMESAGCAPVWDGGPLSGTFTDQIHYVFGLVDTANGGEVALDCACGQPVEIHSIETVIPSPFGTWRQQETAPLTIGTPWVPGRVTAFDCLRVDTYDGWRVRVRTPTYEGEEICYLWQMDPQRAGYGWFSEPEWGCPVWPF